jgi:quercetin dioxygenase-like cupin family protein
MDGIAIGPDGGERVGGVARRHRILCELPALEVIELRFGPEFEGVDLHTHADHTDCFYVLDGEAEYGLDGELVRAGPGSFIAAPVGTVHGFRNAGDGELRLLNIHAPCTGFAEGLRHP